MGLLVGVKLKFRTIGSERSLWGEFWERKRQMAIVKVCRCRHLGGGSWKPPSLCIHYSVVVLSPECSHPHLLWLFPISLMTENALITQKSFHKHPRQWTLIPKSAIEMVGWEWILVSHWHCLYLTFLAWPRYAPAWGFVIPHIWVIRCNTVIGVGMTEKYSFGRPVRVCFTLDIYFPITPLSVAKEKKNHWQLYTVSSCNRRVKSPKQDLTFCTWVYFSTGTRPWFLRGSFCLTIILILVIVFMVHEICLPFPPRHVMPWPETQPQGAVGFILGDSWQGRGWREVYTPFRSCDKEITLRGDLTFSPTIPLVVHQ